jgi:hypothetical protein
MSLPEVGHERNLINSLIAQLQRAIDITLDLDVNDYAVGGEGKSSIGAHIRHNLDFVNALLNGIAERRVDYSARPRDPRVETDPSYAHEQLSFACARLRSLTSDFLPKLVMVRSEINVEVWHMSSVAREIEALHSHTVHHYAIVARLIVERTGREMSGSFGVAPSTLRYRTKIESQTAVPN